MENDDPSATLQADKHEIRPDPQGPLFDMKEHRAHEPSDKGDHWNLANLPGDIRSPIGRTARAFVYSRDFC